MGTVRFEANKYVQSKGTVLSITEFERPFNRGAIPISRERENILPQLVGLVVDYLVRLYYYKDDVIKAFEPCFKGIVIAEQKGFISSAEELIGIYLDTIIMPTDDKSIAVASSLVRFDELYKRDDAIISFPIEMADEGTIKHIKIMVERSIKFFRQQGLKAAGVEFGVKPKQDPNTGRIISDACTGYTPSVFYGEADYLTTNGLWDLKVLSGNPRGADTLQLLMYWIMSQHTKNVDVFEQIEIEKIGFYNPRLDESYYLNVNEIDKVLVRRNETDIFKYDKSMFD